MPNRFVAILTTMNNDLPETWVDWVATLPTHLQRWVAANLAPERRERFQAMLEAAKQRMEEREERATARRARVYAVRQALLAATRGVALLLVQNVCHGSGQQKADKADIEADMAAPQPRAKL